VIKFRRSQVWERYVATKYTVKGSHSLRVESDVAR
jgi:hypothetical protein